MGGVGLTGIVGGKIGLENQSKLLERGGGNMHERSVSPNTQLSVAVGGGVMGIVGSRKIERR